MADEDRDFFSAYAELNAPVSETVELQAALRFDDYSEVGSTFNPKFGVRWQPREDLIVRASAGARRRSASPPGAILPQGRARSPGGFRLAGRARPASVS